MTRSGRLHPKRKGSARYISSPPEEIGAAGIAFRPPRYGIDFLDRRPDPAEAAALQRVADSSSTANDGQAHVPSSTVLPDDLRSGVEALSGLSLDDVQVHYNSSKPAGLQALAYTQGKDIHLAPGQERHLPHEAWHVVQQKQSRVKPTGMISGLALNDAPQLEQEADVMGRRAARGNIPARRAVQAGSPAGRTPAQFVRIKRGLGWSLAGAAIGTGLGSLAGFTVAGPAGGVLGAAAGGTIGAGLGLGLGLRKKKPKLFAMPAQQARTSDWSEADLDDLLAFIQNLRPRERLKYRNDEEIREQILRRPQREAVALFGALQQDWLNYQNPPASSFYQIFVETAQEAHLDKGQTTNCWEFLLYSAWLAGAMTAEQIKKLHAVDGKWLDWGEFGFDGPASQLYSDEHQPRAGDLVFVVMIQGSGKRTLDHVMLSLGGNRVLSHNGFGKPVEQTTIEKVAQWHHFEVRFGPPPW